MTNHWIDLQNCKTILVEGSNVAENHPMAFKWIRKAQENGAKIIHVDPRFTRTSATADVYARIRPGTDAAFQNTMINHILVNKLYDEDYVTTQASCWNCPYFGNRSPRTRVRFPRDSHASRTKRLSGDRPRFLLSTQHSFLE